MDRSSAQLGIWLTVVTIISIFCAWRPLTASCFFYFKEKEAGGLFFRVGWIVIQPIQVMQVIQRSWTDAKAHPRRSWAIDPQEHWMSSWLHLWFVPTLRWGYGTANLECKLHCSISIYLHLNLSSFQFKSNQICETRNLPISPIAIGYFNNELPRLKTQWKASRTNDTRCF